MGMFFLKIRSRHLGRLKQGSKSRLFLFFLLVIGFAIWFVWHSLNPKLPVLGDPPKLYSNQCQQDLSLVFLEAIRRANYSIHLVMFGLSDPGILQALQKKADEEMLVTIYYDAKGSPNLRQHLRECKIHPVQHGGLMHQKILILDEELVLLGSANMTPQSLRMHDNLVIGLQNKKIASFLKQKAPFSAGHLRTSVGGQTVDLWTLPDPKGQSLQAIRKTLRGARHSIRAALFTLTLPSLIDELILAHKRGVSVTVVLDMHSGLGASANAAATLQKAGVRIRFSQGIQLLHHKFVLIDDQTLIAGSTNWTRAAFTQNSDCLIMLHHLLPEQKTWMTSLWKRIATAAQEENIQS